MVSKTCRYKIIFGAPAALNDINVLNHSPLFSQAIDGTLKCTIPGVPYVELSHWPTIFEEPRTRWSLRWTDILIHQHITLPMGHIPTGQSWSRRYAMQLSRQASFFIPFNKLPKRTLSVCWSATIAMENNSCPWCLWFSEEVPWDEDMWHHSS